MAPLLPAAVHAPYQAEDLPPPTTRSGMEILQRFRAGLASPTCEADLTSDRYQRQFRHVIQRLADPRDPVLPLFGYVVDELHREGLPSEFALVPFIESGYRPDARSKAGPAGLWQFIASTARNHQVPMGGGVDGRLSASESTTAAVRYLKTLHGTFAGRWELALMGYNAGEYRILQSLRAKGMNASNVDAKDLAAVSPATHAYVQKVHALSCVIEAELREPSLQAALSREVPILAAVQLPKGASHTALAAQPGFGNDALLAVNPLLKRGSASRAIGVLAPAGTATAQSPVHVPVLAGIAQTSQATASPSLPATAASSDGQRQHTVRDGDSLWAIARRYGLTLQSLLTSNGLQPGAVLKPGTILRLDTTLE